MESLVALGDILLKSIPTFLLVWVLYLYVSKGFVAPLQATLRKRREATEGLRQAADARVREAEQKTASYEEALRKNSAEIYHQQEQDRQRASDQRAEILKQAREKAGARVAAARQEIAREAAEAKGTLERESDQMAQWIARAVLEPSSAGGAQPRATS
jgi:F-type H+-transporting ATPase subunit b